MFHSGHWAAAFINTLEKEGGDLDEGLEFLEILASWVKKLPGEMFGSLAADAAGQLIRGAIAQTGLALPAYETGIRFFSLLVKKDEISRIDEVIKKAKGILDKKRGVVAVSAEYAFPIDDVTETRIRDAIKKQTGAARVDLAGKVNAGLIGGYRLRIGDEIIDASVRSQLRSLLAALQSGQAGVAGGGI